MVLMSEKGSQKKRVTGMANSEDPDKTAPEGVLRSEASLFCTGLSVSKLRFITVTSAVITQR